MMALSQSEEVATLKATYQKQCRVITDMGDFTYIITLQDPKHDLKLKFQITVSYPRTPPNIIITCQKLNPEDMKTLQSELISKTEDSLGCNMINDIYQLAQTWCDEHTEVTDTNATSQPCLEKQKTGGGQKHKATKKAKSKATDEVFNEKKSAMKTAGDVIHRILWDENLSSEHFIIGYVDRFRGIVEKEFSAFSWEDIAAVNYDVLSIPKHRIEYFKYKSMKVWDKSQRLDNMFGSTGGKTITETMDEYKNAELNSAGEVRLPGTALARYHTDTHGPQTDISAKPNYFVAFRVTDPAVICNIGAIQADIVECNPEYKDWCISVQALHITLCRLRLDTQEEIADACRSLRDAQQNLSQLTNQAIDLVFEGVDVFTGRVLYAKVHHNESFNVFVKSIAAVLEQSGLRVCEEHAFIPHLTILKSPRHTVSENQAKRLDLSVYNDFTQIRFGHQTVHAIHLCSMVEQKRPDGFYSTPLTLELTTE